MLSRIPLFSTTVNMVNCISTWNLSTDIEFNLSHTGTMILLAFLRSFRVGIDIEAIRDNFSVDAIAEYSMQL